jgi:hypothetical protein
MTKEEKEHKDALAKADFERRMHLLQATRPPADLSLLKTVAAIRLSPSETTPEKEVVLPESSGATARDPIASPASPTPDPGVETTQRTIEEPPEARPTEVLSSSQRAAARVYASNDPKREALLDAIASQVKARRHQHTGRDRRALVKVDSDVFSRVSNVSYARRIDKIEVLSYLLSRYLPEAGREEPPPWLLQERPDEVLNSFHLVYLEDAEIAARFAWLEQRFGLLKVDIVAAIAIRYLPDAPFVVPPKRRPRRKRF